jgi:hypothetical protein
MALLRCQMPPLRIVLAEKSTHSAPLCRTGYRVIAAWSCGIRPLPRDGYVDRE